jgi:small-conductance mechanosensitive channel
LLHIVVIVGLAHLFLRLVRRLANEVERGNLTIPGFYPDWAPPTFNIFRFLFYAFVLVIIFPYLPGSDSPVFKGVTVFLGVMVSVGSSSAFSNIVAGVVMTYMRSFRVGDRIQVGEMVGDVEEKTMLVTRIRTFHGEMVTIPNAALLAGNTVNFTMAAERVNTPLRLHTKVTIGYDVPWRKVHELLLQAAGSTDGVLEDPEAFVLQKALDDFYVAYELNVHTREPARMNFIYSELHQNIQDAFFGAGVEIMSPHYRALRDGNAAAMPPEFRPAPREGKTAEGTP